jgi:hypothetical protein
MNENIGKSMQSDVIQQWAQRVKCAVVIRYGIYRSVRWIKSSSFFTWRTEDNLSSLSLFLMPTPTPHPHTA